MKHPEALPLPSHQSLFQFVVYASDLWAINKETGHGPGEAIVMETRMLEALRAGKGDTVVLTEGGQMCSAT